MCLLAVVGNHLVQIIKAVMLLSGMSPFMSFMILKHVGFSMETMFQQATAIHEKGIDILGPGGLVSNLKFMTAWALMFGTAGLPHILDAFLYST